MAVDNPTVEYDPNGWRLAPNEARYPGFKLCNANIYPVCEHVPLWRVEERRRGSISTGHYCEKHLSDEHYEAFVDAVDREVMS